MKFQKSLLTLCAGTTLLSACGAGRRRITRHAHPQLPAAKPELRLSITAC